MINEFRGKYRFLSNFYFVPMRFSVRGAIYVAKTNEHYFQAHKATNQTDFEAVLNTPTPVQAKRMGRSIKLRDDWNRVDKEIMYNGVKLKFSQNWNMGLRLIDTHPKKLIEGNYHGDEYWGVNLRTGKGQNNLGYILMVVRNQLMNDLSQ